MERKGSPRQLNGASDRRGRGRQTLPRLCTLAISTQKDDPPAMVAGGREGPGRPSETPVEPSWGAPLRGRTQAQVPAQPIAAPGGPVATVLPPPRTRYVHRSKALSRGRPSPDQGRGRHLIAAPFSYGVILRILQLPSTVLANLTVLAIPDFLFLALTVAVRRS